MAVIGLTAVVLLVVETAAQVRSHVRSNQSVLNALTSNTMYVTDPTTGLKILRPNAVFQGT